MRPPTREQFNSALEEIIENAPSDKLKEIIFSIADNTVSDKRNDLLRMIEQVVAGNYKNGDHKQESGVELTGDVLLAQIDDFRNRAEEGEFYDEERDYEEYHRNEYRYYRDEFDYQETTDFSDEEYVLEMVDLLYDVKHFYDEGDFEVAIKGYQAAFDIMEDEKYKYDEYFIEGFSFKEAIGETVYNTHKALFLRLYYFAEIERDQDAVFNLFSSQYDIFLSYIVDVDTTPLKEFESFNNAYINYLSSRPEHVKHLIDALFVKGGIESLKEFAYEKGHKVPAVFLAYFHEQRERGGSDEEILKIITDGIEIIPEKFASRSILSNELIDITKNIDDSDLLSTAYSTAFYSNPTLDNLDSYLGFIMQNSDKKELKRFELYVTSNKEVLLKKDERYWSYNFIDSSIDMYSSSSVSISKTGYIISAFILDGLTSLLEYLDEETILGFQNEKRSVPVIISLLFRVLAKSDNVAIIDALLNHYCFDSEAYKYENLKQLIQAKSKSLSGNRQTDRAFEIAEKIAINRVRHILKNKLRGGYETSCLLLVASAEVKEITNKSGNRLIEEIDSEYKRYSAFRKELKALTRESNHLRTVN